MRWRRFFAAAKRVRRLWYPVIGAAMAAGAPLGLLVTRCIASGTRLGMAELQRDPLTYGYVLGTTGLVFVGLGYLLGAQEDHLFELSTTDPLTGLLNRRHFQLRLQEELQRALRYRSPLTVMMVDVDRLKAINDAHGHEGGDRAMEAIAECLRTGLRGTDIIARVGGDEFAAILPQTSAADAVALGERVIASVGQRQLPGLPPLSVSIGIAGLESIGEPRAEALLSAADAALYEAKARGRARVVLAPPRNGEGADVVPLAVKL